MHLNNDIYQDLILIKEKLYDKCLFDFSNLALNSESKEYSACTFKLNHQKIIYRASKITATKTGQFVSVWKRNESGITEPYDFGDPFDFIIITCIKEKQLGQFIFSKQTLAEQGIINYNGNHGKRGLRIYPPWDEAENKQAMKTQQWQKEFFVDISLYNMKAINLAKKLFSKY
jgi:hypothetical protein